MGTAGEGRLVGCSRASSCFFFLPPQSLGTRREQVRQLVIDLESRGQQAFPVFLLILRDTGQGELADALSEACGSLPSQPINLRPVELEPSGENHGKSKYRGRGSLPGEVQDGGAAARAPRALEVQWAGEQAVRSWFCYPAAWSIEGTLQSCWEHIILPSRGIVKLLPPSGSITSHLPIFLLGLSILPPLKTDFVSFLLFLSCALLNLCAAPQLVCRPSWSLSPKREDWKRCRTTPLQQCCCKLWPFWETEAVCFQCEIGRVGGKR